MHSLAAASEILTLIFFCGIVAEESKILRPLKSYILKPVNDRIPPKKYLPENSEISAYPIY